MVGCGLRVGFLKGCRVSEWRMWVLSSLSVGGAAGCEMNCDVLVLSGWSLYGR